MSFLDHSPLRQEDVDRLWPQTRVELLGFARALDLGKSEITAAQLRMAVRLAEEAVAKRAAETTGG